MALEMAEQRQDLARIAGGWTRLVHDAHEGQIVVADCHDVTQSRQHALHQASRHQRLPVCWRCLQNALEVL